MWDQINKWILLISINSQMSSEDVWEFFSEIEVKQQISEIEGKRKFCENEDRWNSVKLIVGEAAHRGRDGAGQHSLPPGLSFCNQYYGSYLFNVINMLSVWCWSSHLLHFHKYANFAIDIKISDICTLIILSSKWSKLNSHQIFNSLRLEFVLEG